MVNELLTNPSIEAVSSRMAEISRSVAGMVLENPRCFEHLFKVARHDFYTATHVVNVATWMVPLAYACGMRDRDELAQVFQAGMLHDIGKIFVPADILNKPGALSEDDWASLRQHPELGYRHLLSGPGVPEVVQRVTREHHERCNGSGYPHGLPENAVHPVSLICAVVDSFEAMTAMRPHRRFAHPACHALDTLKREAGSGYATAVVDAWLGLVETLPPEMKAPSRGVAEGAGALVGEANRLPGGDSAPCAAERARTSQPGSNSPGPASQNPQPSIAGNRSSQESAPGPDGRHRAHGKTPQSTGDRGGQKGAACRRRFPRFELAVTARVMVLDSRVDLGTLEVNLRTISQGGASFVSPRPIARGNRLGIRLLTSEWKDRNLIGSVVRNDARADGTFDIGVQFHSVR